MLLLTAAFGRYAETVINLDERIPRHVCPQHDPAYAFRQ